MILGNNEDFFKHNDMHITSCLILVERTGTREGRTGEPEKGKRLLAGAGKVTFFYCLNLLTCSKFTYYLIISICNLTNNSAGDQGSGHEQTLRAPIQ